MKSAKRKQWKALGIFDLIKLSEHNLGYSFVQLMASFHFWHSNSNTFHVPFGMITLTLFDITAITGLKPIGFTYSSSTLKPKHPEVVPIPRQYSINTFIKANMRMKGLVEAIEHVTFLHCWLTFYFFCSRTMQVPQYLLPIAQLLHEGTDLCLSKLFLANLYDSLSDAVTILRSPFPITLISGPFWLLQLWLNSIFESESNTTKPMRIYCGPVRVHLSSLTPILEKTQYFEGFQRFFDLFYCLDSDNKFISPFASRMYGPSWLTRLLSLSKEIISTWREFITPSLLQASFFDEEIKFAFYHPNFVARQFGLSQLLPTTWVPLSSGILQAYTKETQKTLQFGEFASAYSKYILNFIPLNFEVSSDCSFSFYKWWSAYYASMVKPLDNYHDAMTQAIEYQQGPTPIRKRLGNLA